MWKGQQQEISIEGKLKIGLPASASVSSSHDKKTGPGKHRRIRGAIIFRGMRVSKTRALKISTAWITRRRRGISLNWLLLPLVSWEITTSQFQLFDRCACLLRPVMVGRELCHANNLEAIWQVHTPDKISLLQDMYVLKEGYSTWYMVYFLSCCRRQRRRGR